MVGATGQHSGCRARSLDKIGQAAAGSPSFEPMVERADQPAVVASVWTMMNSKISVAIAEGVRRLYVARIFTPRETVQECDRLLQLSCAPDASDKLKQLRHRAATQLL